MLIWIALPYACGGIICNKDEIVTETAPIFSWMLGKHLVEIRRWISRKRGIMEIIATKFQCTYVDSKGRRCEAEALQRLNFTKEHPFDGVNVCEDHAKEYDNVVWIQYWSPERGWVDEN